MTIFETFFQLGFEHIIDIAAIDHILFLLVICAVYRLPDWKRLLILITAFTLGHTITLILATFNLLIIASSLIEFLIPVTIFITAIANLIQIRTKSDKSMHKIRYFSSLVFGMIHGLAFSNELRALLFNSSELWKPLLGFNIGVESGQLVFVSCYFLLSYFLESLLNVKQNAINLVLSGTGLIVSFVLIIERYPF